MLASRLTSSGGCSVKRNADGRRPSGVTAWRDPARARARRDFSTVTSIELSRDRDLQQPLTTHVLLTAVTDQQQQ